MPVLALALVVILSGCSTFSRIQVKNAEHREFKVNQIWVRSALSQPNETYRKINRMTPLLSGNVLLTGNSIDGLVAWDREKGRELWRLPVVNGIEGGAAVIKDRIFFGGSDGFFYSVNVRNGNVHWSFPANSEILSEPLLDTENGIIYFLTAGNVVHALEADSGKPVWVFSRPDANNFSIRGGTKPTLKGDILYVGFSDGYLVALGAKSGQLRWEVQLNRNKRFRDVDTTPVLDGDRLYVAGYDDRLYCLSAEKGDVLWKMDGGGYFGLTVDGNRLYYPTSTGELRALDRETGKLIWSYNVPDGISTSVVRMKGLLIFGESRGALVFLDANGKRVADFSPGRGVFSTPQVDEKSNRVYFISNESNVYALEAAWGRTPGFPFLKSGSVE